MNQNSSGANPVPLYVDLDGTLISTDTLIVNTVALLRRRPWLAPLLPLFVVGGRAAFKERVSSRATIDPARLPYREDVMAFLREEKATGRNLVLATAAHRRVADPVAVYVGLFDDVIASDRGHNIKGRAKLEEIRRHAGGDFDYMGDSFADLPILQASHRAYLAHPSRRLLAAAKETCRIERIFD